MINQDTVKVLANLSLTMFRKNFFGIYHGAISAKQDQYSFMINTRDAIFDEMDEKAFGSVNINKQDDRGNIARIELHIHETGDANMHEEK